MHYVGPADHRVSPFVLYASCMILPRLLRKIKLDVETHQLHPGAVVLQGPYSGLIFCPQGRVKFLITHLNGLRTSLRHHLTVSSFISPFYSPNTPSRNLASHRTPRFYTSLYHTIPGAKLGTIYIHTLQACGHCQLLGLTPLLQVIHFSRQIG